MSFLVIGVVIIVLEPPPAVFGGMTLSVADLAGGHYKKSCHGRRS
jgi:hypothetical protein